VRNGAHADQIGPRLCKLAHVELVTPDVARSLAFFHDLLGMEIVAQDGSRVYLRCFGELDHHSLSLREGPTAVDHVAFRTMRAEDVSQFADRLEGSVQIRHLPAGEELGQGDAIRFTVPSLEAPFEFFYNVEKPLAPPEMRSKLPSNSSRFWPTSAAPRRIDHVNLSTELSAVDPAQAWLRERLGFRASEYVQTRDGNVTGAWLAVTAQVHDLAVTVAQNGQRGQLNHLAFNMESFADVARAADIMVEHDIPVDIAPGRHGVTQGFFYYIRDPGSGHRIELFSGGYLIFDPDWEPLVWSEDDFQEGKHGLAFFGPRWSRENNPNAETTPCLAEDLTSAAGGRAQ
jgi:catechol 2,3 dioxygenase